MKHLILRGSVGLCLLAGAALVLAGCEKAPQGGASKPQGTVVAKDDHKDKGDWWEKHERAKSQCFICDPKLKDKYAAVYQAKNGKAPPEPKENMPKKDGN